MSTVPIVPTKRTGSLSFGVSKDNACRAADVPSDDSAPGSRRRGLPLSRSRATAALSGQLLSRRRTDEYQQRHEGRSCAPVDVGFTSPRYRVLCATTMSAVGGIRTS